MSDNASDSVSPTEVKVHALNRLVAWIFLDYEGLHDYAPKYADDDLDQETDLNESNRSYLAHLWRHQLTEHEQKLVADGDMNAILAELVSPDRPSDRPVNGSSTEDG